MKTTTLGRSGLHVSRIAFGTWQLGGDWGTFDEDAAVAAMRRARELGVNFFDTAQAYGFGASEQMLGKALRDELGRDRDELVIATKGGLRQTGSALVRDASPQWLRRGVDASLTSLGVERIDLYQVHWPDPAVPAAETAGALADLIAEGKIGHVGVSNYNAAQMADFAATLSVETLQPPYHLFRREIEDDVLPYCRENNIGVLVYGPLAHGLLTGTLSAHTAFAADDWRSESSVFAGDTYRRNLAAVRALEKFAVDRGITVSQLAIAWTLSNPAVHVAIVGTRNAGHVEDSLAAAEVSLSAADLDAIDKIMASATPVAGPSPEGMWMTRSGLTVAVLGTGTMGAPMARNLLRAGFGVRVWDRTPAKAARVGVGARRASNPAQAAEGADVLITMLIDGGAVEDVMTGPDGALSMLPSCAVWIQMGTIGVEWSDRLADLAAVREVAFVDAPVSGSSRPAEEGELEIFAAGGQSVRPRVQPIFDVLGRRTVWLDRVGDGSRLKLAVNYWLAVLVEGMVETLTLGEALGLDPRLFLEAIADGPLASDYAMTKGAAMLDSEFTPGFPLRHATKDVELALSAAHRHGVELPLADALLPRWHQAIAADHGDDDVAAAVTAAATAASPPGSRLTVGAT